MATGVAYVASGTRSWVITKSTPGIGLHALFPGQRLDIELIDVEGAEIVSHYADLDEAQ